MLFLTKKKKKLKNDDPIQVGKKIHINLVALSFLGE
jgi:hypothetical protein